MKRVLLFVGFLFLLVLVGEKVLSFTNHPPQTHSPQKPAATTTPTPRDLPVKLIIDSIDVSADIEYVGMDSQGRMDVPKEAENVAWYQLGFAPGEDGSAVIAGHFDDQTGAPAVFYNLSKLKPGDPIGLTLTSGKKLTYIVEKSTSYSFDTFPLQEVFNTIGTPRLNLITCDGIFDKTKTTYLKRLVVYSKMMP